MMRNMTAALFFVSCLSFAVVLAEDHEQAPRRRAAGSDGSPAKAIVYIARNSPANALSAAIAAFLEGTDSRVTSEVTSNVLLIQTSQENQQRVIALLEQLDRTPRTLRIQLHLLRAQGENLSEVDAASLSGPTGRVLESIQALDAEGRVYVANRIELTALENQATLLQVGEDVPVLAARSSFLSAGTLFKVEARLSGESDIVMEVEFEKSEIVPRSAGGDEESTPALQGISQLTHQTTARLRDGTSLLAGTLVSQSVNGVGEAYLVLSATIDTSAHPKRVATLQSSSPKSAPRADRGAANRAADSNALNSRYLAYFTRLLAKYDQNKDKVLDAEERSKMSKDCSAADTDKDGLVTVEELTKWSMKQ